MFFFPPVLPHKNARTEQLRACRDISWMVYMQKYIYIFIEIFKNNFFIGLKFTWIIQKQRTVFLVLVFPYAAFFGKPAYGVHKLFLACNLSYIHLLTHWMRFSNQQLCLVKVLTTFWNMLQTHIYWHSRVRPTCLHHAMFSEITCVCIHTIIYMYMFNIYIYICIYIYIYIYVQVHAHAQVYSESVARRILHVLRDLHPWLIAPCDMHNVCQTHDWHKTRTLSLCNTYYEYVWV
jgi:hypothetical protein